MNVCVRGKTDICLMQDSTIGRINQKEIAFALEANSNLFIVGCSWCR